MMKLLKKILKALHIHSWTKCNIPKGCYDNDASFCDSCPNIKLENGKIITNEQYYGTA